MIARKSVRVGFDKNELLEKLPLPSPSTTTRQHGSRLSNQHALIPNHLPADVPWTI